MAKVGQSSYKTLLGFSTGRLSTHTESSRYYCHYKFDYLINHSLVWETLQKEFSPDSIAPKNIKAVIPCLYEKWPLKGRLSVTLNQKISQWLHFRIQTLWSWCFFETHCIINSILRSIMASASHNISNITVRSNGQTLSCKHTCMTEWFGMHCCRQKGCKKCSKERTGCLLLLIEKLYSLL